MKKLKEKLKVNVVGFQTKLSAMGKIKDKVIFQTAVHNNRVGRTGATIYITSESHESSNFELLAVIPGNPSVKPTID